MFRVCLRKKNISQNISSQRCASRNVDLLLVDFFGTIPLYRGAHNVIIGYPVINPKWDFGTCSSPDLEKGVLIQG